MSEIGFKCSSCRRELSARVGDNTNVIYINPCARCREIAEQAASAAASQEYDRGYEDGKSFGRGESDG